MKIKFLQIIFAGMFFIASPSYGIAVGPLAGIWEQPIDIEDCNLITCVFGTSELSWAEAGSPAPSTLLFEGVSFDIFEGIDDFVKIGELTWANTNILCPLCPSPPPDELVVPLRLVLTPAGPIDATVPLIGRVVNLSNAIGPNDALELLPGAWILGEGATDNKLSVEAHIMDTSIVPSSLLSLSSLTTVTAPKLSFGITAFRLGEIICPPAGCSGDSTIIRNIVPEPNTLALLGAGYVVLAGLRRRKRR